MKNKTCKLAINLLAVAVFATMANAQTTKRQIVRKTTTTTVTKTTIVDTKSNNNTLEMVFVIDTTGSMGGLIDGAKQKVWSIINDVMRKESHPNVRVGLVAYRDKGDEYVTQVLPITEDLDKVYTHLMAYSANGGGDEPENVRRGLADGVKKAGWSTQGDKLAQIVFLVGDAPPHTNYQEEPDVLVTTAEAVRKNMIINTIQCGNLSGTAEVWQQIARRGEGKYFAIAQDGGVQAISTPYDTRLAELANKLGQTYVPYGGGGGAKGETYRREQKARQVSTEDNVSANAAMVAQADRAANKAINSVAYVGDLLQDLENGTTKVDQVKQEDLPEDLKKLSSAERKKEIEKRLAERKKMRVEILSLSKQRTDFIEAERKKSKQQDGFDAAVANALKEQLTKRGIK